MKNEPEFELGDAQVAEQLPAGEGRGGIPWRPDDRMGEFIAAWLAVVPFANIGALSRTIRD